MNILPAMASDRFIKKLKLPSGLTAVISEGKFEARSIGSFSVRLLSMVTSNWKLLSLYAMRERAAISLLMHS